MFYITINGKALTREYNGELRVFGSREAAERHCQHIRETWRTVPVLAIVQLG